MWLYSCSSSDVKSGSQRDLSVIAGNAMTAGRTTLVAGPGLDLAFTQIRDLLF